MHQDPEIGTENYNMMHIVVTPLKKQKNLACHYIETVWEYTKVKRHHYSDKHWIVKIKNRVVVKNLLINPQDTTKFQIVS